MLPRVRMGRAVSATSQVKVATSEHQDFSSDSVLLTARWWFGPVVVHPTGLGYPPLRALAASPTSRWAATCS